MLPQEDKKSQGERADHVYPSGLKFVLVMVSIYIAMFLVALVCPF